MIIIYETMYIIIIYTTSDMIINLLIFPHILIIYGLYDYYMLHTYPIGWS